MTTDEKALKLHADLVGKISTEAKCKIKTREDLSIAYTPGVAKPCVEIANNPEDVYKYTMKANTVAVVSDGSAVLGLGNIGPYAAMPVMEGKAVLFKEFGDVNAVPICLDTQDTQEIIDTVVRIAPGFGGINLEDISAPRCFEIESKLKEYYQGELDNYYLDKSECDYSCFLNRREVDSYDDDNYLNVEDNTLKFFHGFMIFSNIGEEEFYKDENFLYTVE